MKIWIIAILFVGLGCTSQDAETVVKINKIKSNSLQKRIARDLEEFNFMVDYYGDAPAHNDLRKKLTAGLTYLDAASENPEIFRLDSLIKQTKRTSNYQEEQAEIIVSLVNSGQTDLITSLLELEFKNLKQILIKEALLEFDAVSFRVDEPIVLIETNQESYKRGDQIEGAVRLVMGSNNMKSTVSSIRINGDSLAIDNTGKGVINLRIDQSFKELKAEIRTRNPINGRYTFEGSKNVVVK